MAISKRSSRRTAIGRVLIEWEVEEEQCSVYTRTTRGVTQLLGSFTSRKELLEGKTFSLTDGSTLQVQMQDAGLQVIRNGSQLAPLPVSNDQVIAWYIWSHGKYNGMVVTPTGIAQLIGLIGLLSLIAGILLFFFTGTQGFGFVSTLGLGSALELGVNLGFGVLLLGLAFFAYRGSLAAIVIAFALYLLNCVVFIASLCVLFVNSLNSPYIIFPLPSLVPSLFLRFYFLYLLGKGMALLPKIRQAKAEAEAIRSRLLCFRA